MQIEILQSPWLYELMAFHINLRVSKVKSGDGLEGCSLIFDDGKPSLYFEVFDSFKLNIDLSCSICLVSKPKSDLDSSVEDYEVFFLHDHEFLFFIRRHCLIQYLLAVVIYFATCARVKLVR